MRSWPRIPRRGTARSSACRIGRTSTGAAYAAGRADDHAASHPADQRQAPKQDRGKGEEPSDKLELSQEEQEKKEEESEEAEIVELKADEDAENEHLDIAV